MSDPTLADRLEQQLDGLPKWCGQPFPVHPNAAHGGVYNYCPTCCLHQKSHTIAEAAAALRQTPAPAREALVDRLWLKARLCAPPNWPPDDLVMTLREAADRILALTAERDALRKRLDEDTTKYFRAALARAIVAEVERTREAEEEEK